MVGIGELGEHFLEFCGLQFAQNIRPLH